VKKDAAFEALLELLCGGAWRFGEKLSVKQLTDTIGIGRQPIMAALTQLSAAGFVNIVAQVGCQVISPSQDDIADFYCMFARTEGVIAELAALRARPDEYARLVQINTQIAALKPGARDASRRYRTLNLAFHGLLHEMSHAPILQGPQRNQFAMADFFVAETCGFESHMGDATREHREILQAIAAGNTEAARAAAEAHIHAVAESVRLTFDQRRRA